MLPLYLSTLLLGIGLIVTAAALYRTRVVAPWCAIAIGLAGLAMDIGFPSGVVGLIWAGVVLLLIGMVPVGYSVLTESGADWAHTPDFVGFRHVAPTAT